MNLTQEKRTVTHKQDTIANAFFAHTQQMEWILSQTQTAPFLSFKKREMENELQTRASAFVLCMDLL